MKQAGSPSAHHVRASQPALSKLETLHPHFDDSDDPHSENDFTLQSLVPFLSLPNVDSFRGLNCLSVSKALGPIEPMLFEPIYGTLGSTLRTIELAYSLVDGNHITKFLAGCKSLRNFRYSHDTKDFGVMWDMRHFVIALEKSVGDKLDDLSLSILGCGPGKTGTGVISLKGFQKLRKLELDVNAVIGPPFGGEVDRQWDTISAAKAPEGESAVASLLELLPASIESVVLLLGVGDQSIKKSTLQCLDSLFVGFEGQIAWKTKLPALKEIIVRFGAFDADLDHECPVPASIGRAYLAQNADGKPLVCCQNSSQGKGMGQAIYPAFMENGGGMYLGQGITTELFDARARAKDHQAWYDRLIGTADATEGVPEV